MDYLNQFFAECHEVVGAFTGKSVLVAGCGVGLDCIPFVEAGASVTGLDVDRDIGLAYSNPAVRYYRASIEGCDLDSAQYDVVFSAATMEHVHNVEAAYREMVRLVRPGGTIYALAAPLWNSSKGHHLECLYPFPWIHLRRAPKQLLAFCEEHAQGAAYSGCSSRGRAYSRCSSRLALHVHVPQSGAIQTLRGSLCVSACVPDLAEWSLDGRGRGSDTRGPVGISGKGIHARRAFGSLPQPHRRQIAWRPASVAPTEHRSIGT